MQRVWKMKVSPPFLSWLIIIACRLFVMTSRIDCIGHILGLFLSFFLPRGHLLATNTRSVLRSGLNGLKARLEWVQTNDRLYPWRKGKQSKRPIMSLFTVVQTWWQVQHEKREIRLLLLAELCANTKSNSHVHCQENENTDLKDKNVFCFYCQP